MRAGHREHGRERASVEAVRAPAPPAAQHWTDADYDASVLGVGKQQTDRLPPVAGRAIGMQLVLGDDARSLRPEPPTTDASDQAAMPLDPAP